MGWWNAVVTRGRHRRASGAELEKRRRSRGSEPLALLDHITVISFAEKYRQPARSAPPHGFGSRIDDRSEGAALPQHGIDAITATTGNASIHDPFTLVNQVTGQSGAGRTQFAHRGPADPAATAVAAQESGSCVAKAVRTGEPDIGSVHTREETQRQTRKAWEPKQ